MKVRPFFISSLNHTYEVRSRKAHSIHSNKLECGPFFKWTSLLFCMNYRPAGLKTVGILFTRCFWVLSPHCKICEAEYSTVQRFSIAYITQTHRCTDLYFLCKKCNSFFTLINGICRWRQWSSYDQNWLNAPWLVVLHLIFSKKSSVNAV
jgi:hypothetical protein